MSRIYIQFVTNHNMAPEFGDLRIRKWSVEPFEGGVAYEAVAIPPSVAQFALGTRVFKRSGSSWHGRVVGAYSASMTPIGYCVESEREPGSVQIYPEAALARSEGK